MCIVRYSDLFLVCRSVPMALAPFLKFVAGFLKRAAWFRNAHETWIIAHKSQANKKKSSGHHLIKNAIMRHLSQLSVAGNYEADMRPTPAVQMYNGLITR